MIYIFNTVSIKILSRYFIEIDELILKFIIGKKTRTAKTILRSKNKAAGQLDFITYYKAKAIKTF